MADRAPAITVIIATYNWSAALRCAIQSVLRQTFQDFEVLVVGDACTDDSAAVVDAFGDARLRWHNLERNHGSQWGPNNFGLQAARGEWVAYLGHDDLWYPTHLESTLHAARDQHADIAAGVTILYGPPGSGIRALTGLFVNDTYSPQDFVPPSSVVHRRSLPWTSGFWRDPATVVLPVDWAFIRDAAVAGARVVPTNEVSVFKFNAAWRRNSYRVKSIAEQEEMLSRMAREPDLRHRELIGVLQAIAANTFQPIVVPPESTLAPGALARRNRRFKGVEERYDPSVLQRLDRTERFNLGEQLDGFEWYPEETDPVHGPFRWTGPGTSSTIELPVLVDRELRVGVHVLRAIEADVLGSVTMSAAAERLPLTVEDLGDGTSVLRSVVRPVAGARAATYFSLTLSVTRTRRPCDLAINDDRRWLGLAVGWIEIDPSI